MALSVSPEEIVTGGQYPLLAKHGSWERIPLAQVATVQNGFPFESRYFDREKGMPLIRIRDVRSAETEHGYTGEYDTDFVVRPKDILIGMDGDFNAARWKGKDGLLNQRVCRIIPTSNYFDENFLLLCLQPYLNAINAETSSVTVKHLSSRSVEQIPLPLPPLQEQRRIVAKIEELFSELDKGIEALTTAREQLKAYRQSVLKHAFEGRLTMDLRSTQPAWRDTRLGEEIEFLTSGSRGWAEYYADSGDTFIRAQNLKHDRLDLTDIAFVKLPEGNTEGLRTRVNVGDVLITITGANVTRTGVVNSELGTAYVSQHVALCRPRPTIRPIFLYWYLVSEAHGRRQLTDAAYGAGKPGLNLDNIRSVTLSLPSAQEQTIVLERIEAALSVEQELTETIDHELQRTSAIRQSILKKAFSGQLVALCLNDEPASVLLERIRAERESATVKSSRDGRNGHAKNGSKNAQKNRKKQLA